MVEFGQVLLSWSESPRSCSFPLKAENFIDSNSYHMLSLTIGGEKEWKKYY